MRIDLDATIRTSDGEDAGVLQWAIVDPQTKQVTHFVITTDVSSGTGALVPRREVERATREGDVLVLQIGKEELAGFPTQILAGSGLIGVGKGAAVVDASGENVGVADELFCEDHTGELRGFTLRLGGPVRTLFGGGDTVSVAARQVERIGESTIYLNVEAQRLPAPALGEIAGLAPSAASAPETPAAASAALTPAATPNAD